MSVADHVLVGVAARGAVVSRAAAGARITFQPSRDRCQRQDANLTKKWRCVQAIRRHYAKSKTRANGPAAVVRGPGFGGSRQLFARHQHAVSRRSPVPSSPQSRCCAPTDQAEGA